MKLVTLYVLGIENWYFIILSNSIPEDEIISKPLTHPVMETPLRFHKILNVFFVLFFCFFTVGISFIAVLHSLKRVSNMTPLGPPYSK